MQRLPLLASLRHCVAQTSSLRLPVQSALESPGIVTVLMAAVSLEPSIDHSYRAAMPAERVVAFPSVCYVCLCAQKLPMGHVRIACLDDGMPLCGVEL